MMKPNDAQRVEALRGLLVSHDRVAIVGGPRTGKTWLSASIHDREVIHTDKLIHLPWGEVPVTLIATCRKLPRFLIEGVQVARALRAGLVVDAVLYLDLPMVEQSKGQASMGKSVDTIFREWRALNRVTHVSSPDLS